MNQALQCANEVLGIVFHSNLRELVDKSDTHIQQSPSSFLSCAYAGRQTIRMVGR